MDVSHSFCCVLIMSLIFWDINYFLQDKYSAINNNNNDDKVNSKVSRNIKKILVHYFHIDELYINAFKNEKKIILLSPKNHFYLGIYK